MLQINTNLYGLKKKQMIKEALRVYNQQIDFLL